MKKLPFIASIAAAFILFSLAGYAQQTAKITNLLELEEGQYFADRDSAYLDPYYGLKKLIYGNRRFAENKSIKPRQTDADLKNNELGQKPFATIIGCADSRVPNEIIFDQGVGDLFITRTAGQVMAEASYGTIEYSSEVLNTKLIVVLGHESCGAVQAAMQLPENPPGHVVTLINAIKPASLVAKRANVGEEESLNLAIRQNVLEQVNLLRGLEPVLSRSFEKGNLLIVGAVYNLSTGEVEFLEETVTSLPKFAQNQEPAKAEK
ncbi:carbonic anhydrase [Tunicatimonas pelagia]|uniref:carbonic anhydrase n=1 Tax=Tunicatimonas pelagia TaxID=931531 RepID=UPI00266697AE|nr:carbonic anhydrase [Tunicatimonas pelagia]WKN43444.1 carbonic anhydrase [Tunicatimonas pelagia]